jgi:hypothetical protein
MIGAIGKKKRAWQTGGRNQEQSSYSEEKNRGKSSIAVIVCVYI